MDEGSLMKSKIEKRVCIFAIVFVALYIGAIAMTIHSRVADKDTVSRIESAGPAPGEEHMMLAELLLPMLICLTVAVCFMIVRKRREKALLVMDETEE